MSEQGTKAQAQNHKQNGWKEPPQTKSNTPAPITNEMLDIVLACYFSNPVAFAAHTHDLPLLFTGRRRTLIDIHNHLLVELDGVTLESVVQEARQRLGADEAKVEKLQEHVDVIASVDAEQETPYVLSRIAAWINERVQERAATRYLEAPGADQGRPVRGSLAGAEGSPATGVRDGARNRNLTQDRDRLGTARGQNS
jgi:hypothetical protein